ncbi:MAG: outer membrane beta-barrel protein, partial [Pirellulaceae bacterium]
MRSLQITLATTFIWNLMLGMVTAQTLQQPSRIAGSEVTSTAQQSTDVVAVNLLQDEPATSSPSDLNVVGSDMACDTKSLGKESCSGITVGGWTQVGYHTQGTNGVGQGSVNNYPNHFQVQQQWLYLEKEVVRGDGFDWGFRFDYVYGTDGQDVQASGGLDWDNAWDQGGHYGHAIPQLYLELAYDRLNVKLGHFINNAGLESMPATANAFYSHTYAMRNQPVTYTGVVADYAISDSMSVVAGWVEGWNTGFSSSTGGSMVIGGLEAQLTDAISFSYIATGGDTGAIDSMYSHTIVMGWSVGERLDYTLQLDAQTEINSNSGTLYGITQYLNYTLSDDLNLGARFEWIERPDGPNAILQNYDLTVGVQAQVAPRLVVRP